MTTTISGTAALLLTSSLLCSSAWASEERAHIRSIVDAAIVPLMAEHDLPGMAVAVTAAGKSYTFNYGHAARETKEPVTDATLFELGSVSKPMTATLASYAQVIGKLALDAHPSKYLPALKGSPIDAATVLHLGTYTAGGLPQQFPERLADERMIEYFRSWTPQARPGTQRRYSNPSLGLFGHLTALALKRDFAEAMEQEVFAALGMRNSHIRIPEGARGNYAWGHDQQGKPGRMQAEVLSAPTYGVVSTASDVMRLVEANIEPGKLTGPMRRAVEGTQIGYFAVGPMVQGLGWEQYPYPVKVEQLVAGNSSTMSMEPNAAKRIDAPPSQQAILFNKTGATRGFSNYVAFVPLKKIGIVMLANKSYPAAARVKAAHAILEQLDPARH